LAKKYITQAISHADELDIGHGHGPVNHFFNGHAESIRPRHCLIFILP